MKARNAFLAAMALALGLPLLGWTGLRGFVGVHGFDTPDVKPRFSVRNVLSGRFRRDFETHWGHVFFGRTEMLFAKNGLYELLNAGLFHSGYAGRIVQGRGGQLFEKPYVDVVVAESLPVESAVLKNRSSTALKRLQGAVASLGPDAPRVAFVLAPGKASVFRDFLPRRYRRLLRPGDEPYALWRDLLGHLGIPCFDASRSLPPGADGPASPALFPYTGTHWTVHWAAHAASNALALAAPDLPRPVPLAPRLVPHRPFTRDDRDMAGLLNLPWPYRRSPDLYAHPVFSPPFFPAPSAAVPSVSSVPSVPVAPPPPSSARVLVFGDSFSVQVRDALVASGAYAPENVRLVYNEIPSAAAFARAMREADAALFVYSSPSLASSRVATTADILANHLRPVMKPGRRYALGRSPYLGAGDWGEENGGRVVTLAPGASGALVLPVSVSAVRRGADPVLLLFPSGAPEREIRIRVETGAGRVETAVLPAGVSEPLSVPLVRRHALSGPGVRYPTITVDTASPPLRLVSVEVQ